MATESYDMCGETRRPRADAETARAAAAVRAAEIAARLAVLRGRDLRTPSPDGDRYVGEAFASLELARDRDRRSQERAARVHDRAARRHDATADMYDREGDRAAAGRERAAGVRELR